MAISVDIGKIYCKLNNTTGEFDKLRILSASERDGKKYYIACKLDKGYDIASNERIELSEDEFNRIKKEWILLKSEGVISLSSIVMAENEYTQIKDVIAIFFPNDEKTGEPESSKPAVMARQALDNMYAENSGTGVVGFSVTLKNNPTGFSFLDFMSNISVLSSSLTHVYKTDSESNLAILLANDSASQILKDLFDHEVRYLENTVPNFKSMFNPDAQEEVWLHGYNNTIKGFLKNTGFMDDVYYTIGIVRIPELKVVNNVPFDVDDLLLISTLYGGIKINKAVPLQFDYDININLIKMNYLLIMDSNSILWIVPYTTSPDEVDAVALYNLTEERTLQLQERLKKCAQVYYNSKNE